MDEQKTILRDGALFSTHPFSTKNHKTTIIPLEVSEDFFGGECGENNALSEAAFPTSTPLKNCCNRGGDDRKVLQNGMPFCTGCTLSGHILNLPEGLRPLGTPILLSENETTKHPLEVSPFYFRIRWECIHRILVYVSRCLPKHFVVHVFYTTSRSC